MFLSFPQFSRLFFGTELIFHFSFFLLCLLIHFYSRNLVPFCSICRIYSQLHKIILYFFPTCPWIFGNQCIRVAIHLHIASVPFFARKSWHIHIRNESNFVGFFCIFIRHLLACLPPMISGPHLHSPFEFICHNSTFSWCVAPRVVWVDIFLFSWQIHIFLPSRSTEKILNQKTTWFWFLVLNGLRFTKEKFPSVKIIKQLIQTVLISTKLLQWIFRCRFISEQFFFGSPITELCPLFFLAFAVFVSIFINPFFYAPQFVSFIMYTAALLWFRTSGYSSKTQPESRYQDSSFRYRPVCMKIALFKLARANSTEVHKLPIMKFPPWHFSCGGAQPTGVFNWFFLCVTMGLAFFILCLYAWGLILILVPFFDIFCRKWFQPISKQ